MTPPSRLLSQLMDWYFGQCDGEWEHRYGITIETLDNPGWRMRIDLTGTPQQHCEDFEKSSDFGDPNKWMIVKKHGDVFEGAGGPERLDAIIAGFLAWKERSDD